MISKHVFPVREDRCRLTRSVRHGPGRWLLQVVAWLHRLNDSTDIQKYMTDLESRSTPGGIFSLTLPGPPGLLDWLGDYNSQRVGV